MSYYTDAEQVNKDLSWAIRALFDRDGGQRGEVLRLSRGLGQSSPNISNKLNGNRHWSLYDFYKVADHFDINPAALLEMMEEARTHQARVERITQTTS